MKGKLGKVREIAREVREVCEDYVKRTNKSDNTLSGLCAAASRLILIRLKEQRIPAKLVMGRYDPDGHCWIETCGHVVDVTATQYGIRQPVYITRVGKSGLYTWFTVVCRESDIRKIDISLRDWYSPRLITKGT